MRPNPADYKGMDDYIAACWRWEQRRVIVKRYLLMMGFLVFGCLVVLTVLGRC